MAQVLGVLVGTPQAAANFVPVPNDLAQGNDFTLVRDYAGLTNANLINDTIVLGTFKSTAFLSPGSKVWFDAMGTGVKLNIGDAAHASGLAVNLDVSAAGSSDLHVKFTAGVIGQPLWQKLGYSSDPGGTITLIATIVNANVANTGNVGWQITGKNH